MLLEQKQLREVRKRAFDEVTICRRATEEALKRAGGAFPGPRPQRARGPADDPSGPDAEPVAGDPAG